MILFAALVSAGVALRVALMRAQTPGFVAVTDSAYYLFAAHLNVFAWAATDAAWFPWPAGYPTFLKLVYAFDEHLSAVIVVQHALGILTATLWFMALRRVVPAIWALFPAVVILFAGPQLFLEHAPMAESLYSFLLAALAYAAVRVATGGSPALWGALAGLAAASAACVRVIGLAFVAVVVLWLLAAASGVVRQRLIAAAAAVLAAGLVFGTYLVEMKRETGFGGPVLTRSGTWSGPAAGHPTGYYARVGRDLTRYWSSIDRGAAGGYSYDGLIGIMTPPVVLDRKLGYPYLTRGKRFSSVNQWYRTYITNTSDGIRSALFTYERHTRLEGLPFFLLLLLGAIGLPFARDQRLHVGILIALLAGATLLTPVLYLYYDARYAVPGYAPLAAAAAIGAASLVERWARARQSRRPALDSNTVAGSRLETATPVTTAI